VYPSRPSYSKSILSEIVMVKKGRSERNDATPFLTNKISLNILYREKEIVDLWLFDTKIMLRSVWKKNCKKKGGNVGHDPMYLCHWGVNFNIGTRRGRRITTKTRKNCFRYLKPMSPLNVAICTTTYLERKKCYGPGKKKLFCLSR
jgi:hypothetical protein